MKRLLCKMLLGLLGLLMCACVPKTENPPIPVSPDVSAHTSSDMPSPVAFAFTRENMPRLDGSTSTAPLAEAVCSFLLGENREAVADLVRFNKTTTAYYNLISGNADLLIVGEDNAEILAEKARQGFEWERQPFATDAFVFVVNEDNPVDSITIDEARRVYTGEITNWRELGGDDAAIIPFQRNQDAGSQNLMEKLVMRGQPMMEAPSGFVVATMGQLMEAVKSYDGSPGAIGYTVYYYAEEMKMAQGLKILALEGVAPNPETIRSQEYPLLNPKYVVIPADAPEDAPNRILFNWLLSADGQQLVAQEGYVAVFAEPGAPVEPLPEVGSRWYAGYTENLIPRDDYGTLVPYAGARLMDNWPADTGCLYGLMTEGGVAVTDAVYSSVTRPTDYGGPERTVHPLLALRRGGRGSGEENIQSLYAIAALDGSWCTEFRYRFLRADKTGLLLFADDGVTYMSPGGEIINFWSMSKLGLTRNDVNELFDGLYWGDGWGGRWCGDYLVIDLIDGYTEVDLFHLPSGQRKIMPLDEWNAYEMAEYASIEEPSEEELNALLPPDTPRPVEFLWNDFTDNGLPGLLSTMRYCDYMQVFLPDGTPLPSLSLPSTWYGRVRPVGGLIEVLDLNTASYYDRETMECVFRTYLGYDAD